MLKGHIRVSEKLQAFIEKEFQSMLRFEEELKKDREIRPELRKEQDRKHKKLKRSGSEIEVEISKTVDLRKFALKGKAKFDLNNFIYMCVYLLQKERYGSKYGVYGWISKFLTLKKYLKECKKSNRKKPYTANDIKRIVIYQFEDWSRNYDGSHIDNKQLKVLKGAFTSQYDHMFEKFCNPQPMGWSLDDNDEGIIWDRRYHEFLFRKDKHRPQEKKG